MIRVLGVVMAMLAVAVPAVHTVRLDLPAPTGKLRVGTTSLHLVDRERLDPLAPTARPRELMVRLWYPTTGSRQPRAGYVPPDTSQALVQALNTLTGTDLPGDLLTFPTHGRALAPATGTRHPVVLLSPALNELVAFYTGLAEELASRGYVVAGVDSTFEAPAVEFPGGRVEVENPDVLQDNELLLTVRTADMRFVLEQLTAVAAGRNPDAGHRRLPAGLGRSLDLSRIAAVGHSMGSMTVVRVMDADQRIDAGVALDGNPLGPAVINRPFLLFGNQHHTRAEFPDWATFYDQLRGHRLHLVLAGAEHQDLSDITLFKKDLDLGAVFLLGPIDGERALAIQRTYVTAWLDFALRGRHNPVLAGESREFPEIDFQP